MATIKSHTDLEQSKKLAEILPLESADMSWVSCDNGNEKYFRAESRRITLNYEKKHWIPCWSLTALFGILPMLKEGEDIANPFIAKTPDNEYYVVYATLTKEVDSSGIFDNPVDACYDMIINLHKLYGSR